MCGAWLCGQGSRLAPLPPEPASVKDVNIDIPLGGKVRVGTRQAGGVSVPTGGGGRVCVCSCRARVVSVSQGTGDLKKKEKELKAKEDELKKRELVSALSVCYLLLLPRTQGACASRSWMSATVFCCFFFFVVDSSSESCIERSKG